MKIGQGKPTNTIHSPHSMPLGEANTTKLKPSIHRQHDTFSRTRQQPTTRAKELRPSIILHHSIKSIELALSYQQNHQPTQAKDMNNFIASKDCQIIF
jgi:hypothetical protein